MSETWIDSLRQGALVAWDWTKRAARWAAASLPVVLVVVGAIILLMLGAKNVQIGGVLGKLLGKKTEGKKTVDVANTVPPERVDEKGNLIPPGVPDSQGTTQAKVVAIEPPGLFDDPSQVKIIPPGETKPVVVDLPDGVKHSDVDKVIVVKPEVLVVTVKDKSGVPASSVDDLLKKYGT